jgi:hypothetical protein
MPPGWLTWSVEGVGVPMEYDEEVLHDAEEYGAVDMRLYGPEADAGDAGDEAHRAVLREYVPAGAQR